jgi:hypothetical protein
MNPNILSRSHRWKLLGLVLGLVLTTMPAATVIAAEEPADAEVARQQAVSNYVEGATKEMDAYRQQISTAGRPDNQQPLNEAKAKLAECDKLVAELKSAGPGQFDALKSSYERTRGEMVKALLAAQQKA